MGKLFSTALVTSMLIAGGAWAQSTTGTTSEKGVHSATPPAAVDATRKNSQTVAPGMVREGTSVPMTGGGDSGSSSSGSGGSSGSAGASGSAGGSSSGGGSGSGSGSGSGGGSGGSGR